MQSSHLIFQIAFPHLTIFTDRTSLGHVDYHNGKKLISDLWISAAELLRDLIYPESVKFMKKLRKNRQIRLSLHHAPTENLLAWHSIIRCLHPARFAACFIPFAYIGSQSFRFLLRNVSLHSPTSVPLSQIPL